MNAEPHTHELNIDNIRGSGVGGWTWIRYGDQRLEGVSNTRLFYRTRLRHAIRKMVRRHDEGSRLALVPNAHRDFARRVALEEAQKWVKS